MGGAVDDRTAAVPVPLRRVAAALAAAAAVAVVVLGIRYAGTATAGRTDLRVRGMVTALLPEPGPAAGVVARLGDPLPVVVAAVLLAAVCAALGRRRLAVLAVAGPGLTGLATTGLKPVFGRTIDESLAFPSGHTAALTALALVAALIVVNLVGAGRAGGLLLITPFALGAGVAMGVTLVAMGVHYPTDTVGGFGTAVAVVLGTALAIDRLAERRRPG